MAGSTSFDLTSASFQLALADYESALALDEAPPVETARRLYDLSLFAMAPNPLANDQQRGVAMMLGFIGDGVVMLGARQDGFDLDAEYAPRPEEIACVARELGVVAGPAARSRSNRRSRLSQKLKSVKDSTTDGKALRLAEVVAHANRQHLDQYRDLVEALCDSVSQVIPADATWNECIASGGAFVERIVAIREMVVHARRFDSMEGTQTALVFMGVLARSLFTIASSPTPRELLVDRPYLAPEAVSKEMHHELRVWWAKNGVWPVWPQPASEAD